MAEEIIRLCEKCGTRMKRRKLSSGNREAYPKWKNRRHCSAACRFSGRPMPTPRITRPCASCAKPTKNPKYCSKPCFGAANAKPNLPPGVMDHRGRQKARLRFPLTECARCHTTKHLQRHHRDLNPRNNTPDNITIFCRTCHSALHTELRHWTKTISFWKSTEAH